MIAFLSPYFIILLSPRSQVPLNRTLSPAFAEAASRRQATGGEGRREDHPINKFSTSAML